MGKSTPDRAAKPALYVPHALSNTPEVLQDAQLTPGSYLLFYLGVFDGAHGRAMWGREFFDFEISGNVLRWLGTHFEDSEIEYHEGSPILTVVSEGVLTHWIRAE